jgi:uncharacterized protein (TIGR02231 family)
MKARIVIFLASLLLAPATMAGEVQEISHVAEVTVFPHGAEVTRIADVELDAGPHIIVLSDLPANIIDNSLRVEGSAGGDLEISSVDARQRFVIVGETGTNGISERQRLEDEIQWLRDKKSRLQAKMETARTQKQLMIGLAGLPTREQAGREDWVGLFTLIGSKMEAASETVLKYGIEKRNTDRKIKNLEKQLAEMPPKCKQRTEIRIHVNAGSSLKGELTIRYQANNAWWRPFYDARLGTTADAASLHIVRRAEIGQRTGESWDNVKLFLSTTRPSDSSSAPQLHPMQVREVPDIVLRKSRARGEATLMSAPKLAMDAALQPAAMAEEEAVARTHPFHAIFSVPGKVSIGDTGEVKKVRLAEARNFKPELVVRAVPKADPAAYIYASFVHDAGPALLPGGVALYRDGVFVGTGKLPLVNAGQKHDLGFGIDEAVKISRDEIKRSKGKEGIIISGNIDERYFKTRVRSYHKMPVKVIIVDQVPYSTNEEIRVEMLSSSTPPSRKNLKDKRGILAWDFDLDGGSSKSIHLNYKISWPKDMRIIGND